MAKTLRPILRIGGAKGPYLRIPIDIELYDAILEMDWACEDCLNETFQAILREGIAELLDGTRDLETSHHQ